MSDTTPQEYAPSPAAWVREQVEQYEGSGGTAGTTLRDTDMPVVILTMRGAKTGKIRKVPLMRVEHDGDYLAVASKGGAPSNPQWFNNIVDTAANPTITVRDGATVGEYRARPITDDAQRAQWWERAVAAYPPYADYAKKTSRTIPLFLLTPVG
ncbi:nitroreductase family deazaflavin-dependent oxidoreductase [Gordonia sp. X0973]|uniref:nitroreductase family deazaflavin-dependent oxidoreductase n=1 Tax=Gordonia sp. X0973 TaxID=2742602 RepID=UPI000F5285C7|nr:nitroreductase family deazaflavin-dependent oxidoreductase [Gordonia sp. X0973]QKT07473.1 nitroreductase family deazaflavin-dependent oxidoreductase [Gordonia sp. X0973]